MTEIPAEIAGRVETAVNDWLAWLPSWRPQTHRGRSRICRRCTGSPVLTAAGLTGAVPHQVVHALNVRLQRIIDAAVDQYVEQNLPLMHRELSGDAQRRAGGFEPNAGLPPELDGLDLDPEPEDGQPYLFTLGELAAAPAEQFLEPLPPLTEAEKYTLAFELSRADVFADMVGQEICFMLVPYRQTIAREVARFVEPQVQALLESLSEGLEPPRSL